MLCGIKSKHGKKNVSGKNTKINIIILFIAVLPGVLMAHEPIFGHGPHVLYKGGLAPAIVWNSGMGFIENEFELHYGVTKNWTAGLSVPLSNADDRYEVEDYMIKNKYRFYADFGPGVMDQIAAFGGYKFSNNTNRINALILGLTGGRESTTWYWFASTAYTAKFILQNGTNPKPGNEINYDLTLGCRINKVDYYKPDLVIFLEFLGKYLQKSSLHDSAINNSGGNAWSVAPTFMLTYRNWALRGGVEFGLARSGDLKKPADNFKIGIETHL